MARRAVLQRYLDRVQAANALPAELLVSSAPAPDIPVVYFVLATELQFIKIGYAQDFQSRLRVLRSSSPDNLDVLGVIHSTEAGALEHALHRKFAADRVRGEWFRSGPELVQMIAEHAVTWIDLDRPPTPEMVQAFMDRAQRA